MLYQTAEQHVELAARIIKNPNKWTQGALARAATGREVAPHTKPAVRFDARGVLMLVSGYEVKGKGAAFKRGCYLMFAADLCAHLLYKKTLDAVNDQLGHEAVLAVMRRTWQWVRANPQKEDAFGARDD